MSVEYPARASNRLYYMSGPCNKWRDDLFTCVQMKGETVIALGRVPSRHRKKMIKTVQQGFSTARNALWMMLLNLIMEEGPEQYPSVMLVKRNARYGFQRMTLKN